MSFPEEGQLHRIDRYRLRRALRDVDENGYLAGFGFLHVLRRLSSEFPNENGNRLRMPELRPGGGTPRAGHDVSLRYANQDASEAESRWRRQRPRLELLRRVERYRREWDEWNTLAAPPCAWCRSCETGSGPPKERIRIE